MQQQDKAEEEHGEEGRVGERRQGKGRNRWLKSKAR